MRARRYWWWLVALLLLSSMLTWPNNGYGQDSETIFYVDTLADNPVTDLSSHCTDNLANANCSLRQALTKANKTAETNPIIVSFELITEGQVSAPPYIITLTNGRLPPITRSHVRLLADLAGSLPQVAINANGNDVGLALNGGSAIVSGLAIYGASNADSIYRGSGIFIGSASNEVRNCLIGLDLDGNVPSVPNRNGIVINGSAATNNQIGVPGNPNTIAGNVANGVWINNASQNTIRTNRIGVLLTTTTLARPNGGYGIQVISDLISDPNGRSELNTIGGAANLERNIIAANEAGGILVSGARTITTTIASNLIGFNLDADPAIGNDGDGIIIEDGAQSTIIGSASATQPLIISGNTGFGIRLRANGDAPINTTIRGFAAIGLSRSGSSARPNTLGGIIVSESAGTTTIGSANTIVRIGGNNGPGLTITSSGVTVTNTQIGVFDNVTGSIPNNGGVLIANTSQITMTASTITANTAYDVRIENASAVTIAGNTIGLSVDRRSAPGSFAAGIAVTNSTDVTIGTDTSGNVIAAASGPAIAINGGTNITARANILGLRRDTSGDALNIAAPNTGPAIQVNGASNITIANNVIGGNGSAAGISLAATQSATIQQNQIGWIVDPDDSNTFLARPAGVGIDMTGVTTATVSGNLIRLNVADGIRLTDTTSVTITNTNVIEQNGGNGIQVGGGSLGVAISGNRLRANNSYAVLVADNARRVRITQNQIAANSAGGIQLQNATRYNGTPPDPDQSLNRPNHSIDPPFNLQLTQDGQLVGQVFASNAESEASLDPVSACAGCVIHVYSTDPALPSPDGQGWQLLEVLVNGIPRQDIHQVNSLGEFSAILTEPPGNHRQIALTATDRFGNTSEFSVFTPTIDLRLVPIDAVEQSAAPGSSITYRLRLENHGTLGLNRLRLSTSGTLSGWTVTAQPADRFNILPGASQLVTVTLSLPTGTHPSVQVPITDTTTLTLTAPAFNPVTQTLRTSVQALPVIVASPASGSAIVLPGVTHIYRHQLTNNGNVTTTIDVNATTSDLIGLDTYNTTVLTPTVTLAPGASAEIAVAITVPLSSQTTDASGNPVRATTVITATPRGFSGQAITMTDVTTTGLRYAAELRSSYEQDVQAGREVVFLHTLRNTGNGRATFQLNFAASRGSTLIAFESGTSGVTISSNTVTLDNIAGSGRINQITLRVRVRISETILPDTRETLRIWVSVPGSDEALSGAEVQDVAIVRDPSGLLIPAVWIPLILQ
ncbi:right-handed parallel beta-helix repeat-containing protein [Chloroflexus sp.]|uniref:right-handed parallel beta-helix repeat-containing protein n=1 Tax=Chloroflexus sp. TaxID=1904827 RepID=UPI0026234A1A|nr:right-handed parallel beta-helix repeat-containing protein [uncultured Chloroflexus sp.]